MPIRIPDNLPAREILKKEHVFFMNESDAERQDVRPLEIAILNLMPNKVRTEAQLIRTLSYTPLQINVTFLHTASYKSKNTPEEHLLSFYKTFDDVRDKKFDGFIITGAPVETMAFEDVLYWPELNSIFEWSKHNVYSSFYICWGAQAALYHFHDVPKYELDKKQFGVFKQDTLQLRHVLLRGFDDYFHAPVSRHTAIDTQGLEGKPVELLAASQETGACLAFEDMGKRVYMFNHLEYDPTTLKEEYERDVAAGKTIDLPRNYFTDDDPEKVPHVLWRSHRNLLFSNWVNMIYQGTEYDIKNIGTGALL